MKYKILITDPISESGISILKDNNCEIIDKTESKDSIHEIIDKIDGWIIRSGTKISETDIKAAEKEIKDLKNNSREKIHKIAIETSSDLAKQLIDVDVNNSSISAIVEDISRKNKNKYHGV